MAFTLKELKKIDPFQILMKDEVQKCIEAFGAFDKNQTKMIEKEELKKVLEEFGQNPTDEDIIKMINEVDQTGRGAISIEDFLKVIAYQKKLQEQNDEEDIRLAFQALCGQNDDNDKCPEVLDIKKLKNILQTEFNLTVNVENLIKEIAPSSSKEVKYKDFKNLLLN